jgi:hypothetical protein
VQLSNANPQEKKSDGEFGAYHGDGVEQVAVIPGMFGVLYALDGQVAVVFSGSIVYADARRRGVGNKEDLKA